MKKITKKNKNKPAQRKKIEKKREKRKNQQNKKLALKEGLRKTEDDKVFLNPSDQVKSLKSLVRDIYNLREARRQINFLGVDIKNISRRINERFIDKCTSILNKICKLIIDEKTDHKKKKDKYFKLTKEYYKLIPHHFSIPNANWFVINDKNKIKKEVRILELLISYKELKLKDEIIRSEINEIDNNSVNLNESLNMSINNPEKSVEEENHANISTSYYEKALIETDYIFKTIQNNSDEFTRIKNFLYRYSTKNKCTYPPLKLLQLYKLNDKYHSNPECENLYWFGCETPHLYSYLRHGLRLPLKISPNIIYHFGYGVMISHNPYTQLQKCIARNNIAYLFVCGNNGLNSKIVHNERPKYPNGLQKEYDSVCISHDIKIEVDEEEYDEYDGKDYDCYCDYVVYDLNKIKLLYLAKIQIP